MEQIEKFIKKLSKKHALEIVQIFDDITSLKLKNYDIEKMKGFKDLYRIRVGKIRIIFRKEKTQGRPVYIEYRGNAYKKF